MKYLSERITAWLIKHGTISQDDRELYEYATYSFILTISPLILILMIGVIMEKTVKSVLLIIPFMLIRKFSGGYHAKHSWVCMIFSCGILFLCVYLIDYIKYGALINAIMIGATVNLIVFSPIDSENRSLDLSEKKEYKIITAVITIVFAIIYCLLLFIGSKTYAVCIAEGIILTAVLQIPCVLQKIKFMTRKNKATINGMKNN